MKTDEDHLMDAARRLAVACEGSKIKKAQLQQVLAHLQQGRNIAATLKMLKELEVSCFSKRFPRDRNPYKSLSDHVDEALRSQGDWRRGARLVGWACRCLEAGSYRAGWTEE